MRLLLVSIFLIGIAATHSQHSLLADGPRVIDVWPARAPGVAADAVLENKSEQNERIGTRVTSVSKPTLTIYRPAKEKDTKAAVVICPGGGYHILALDLEGTEVARWLNEIGVTGIVLQYRVPRAKELAKHELPLKDAQRAISIVRQHANDWGIEPDKIGILGFSAGGHLAATASTNFSTRTYDAVDATDEISCRPDFSVLIYPAYLTGEKGELGVQLADEVPVSDKTPPAIMIHAQNDGVTCNSSIAYFLALKEHKIPAELHIFPTGGHGYGLRPTEHAVTGWPALVERWLRSISVLSAE
ncbi:MAG: alpha/beta hydrolase [Pirellulaceae bacterium]